MGLKTRLFRRCLRPPGLWHRATPVGDMHCSRQHTPVGFLSAAACQTPPPPPTRARAVASRTVQKTGLCGWVMGTTRRRTQHARRAVWTHRSLVAVKPGWMLQPNASDSRAACGADSTSHQSFAGRSTCVARDSSEHPARGRASVSSRHVDTHRTREHAQKTARLRTPSTTTRT